MTQHLTKRFVNHGGIGFAPQSVSEFPLEHTERALYIAALVVVLQKLFPLELEVVEHLLQQHRCLSSCVALEGDKWRSVVGCYGSNIGLTPVGSISRYLRDRKCLSRSVHQPRQYRTVARVFLSDFYSGNDIRFDSAN